jgi:hypothetical protein
MGSGKFSPLLLADVPRMADSTERACTVCRGQRWVCEDHPADPAGHCGSAGMPCPVCNEEGLELPAFDVLYASVDPQFAGTVVLTLNGAVETGYRWGSCGRSRTLNFCPASSLPGSC